MVSATVACGSPAMATMSPASAVLDRLALKAAEASTFETRPCSISLPSRQSALTGWFGLTVPDVMRPVRTRPRKGSASSVVASMRKAPSVDLRRRRHARRPDRRAAP